MDAKFVELGVRVKDLEKSIEFYTGVLGMKEKKMGRTHFGETKGTAVGLESSDGRFALELNHYDEDSPFNTPYIAGEGLDHIAFAVGDLDSALKEAKEKGHPTVKMIKTETKRWAYIEDPDGIWIELNGT